jgi:anti-anti-sigma factor
MDLQLRETRGALVVHPAGELTEDGAVALHREIGRELGNARDVILDLSAVDRIAVGALPILFRIQQQARDVDGALFIAAPSDAARRLFELTRVTENLCLVASAEDALAVRT